jgi:hypothetical protein
MITRSTSLALVLASSALVNAACSEGSSGGKADAAPSRPDAAADLRPAVDAAPADAAAADTRAVDAGGVEAARDAAPSADAPARAEAGPPDTGRDAQADRLLREVGGAGPALIDDLEDCDNLIPEVADRKGGWYVYKDDAKPATTVDPAAWAALMPGAPASPRCATRVRATVAMDSFAGMGVGLAGNGTYNASGYMGISFWAKGSGKLRFAVQIEAIVPPSNGGTCAADCWNAHGIDIELTADWKKWEFTWSDLKQDPNWGTKADFDVTRLRDLQWQFPTGMVDLTVDHVSFRPEGAPADAGAAVDAIPRG